MSTLVLVRRILVRPSVAVVLLLLTAAAWGLVFVRRNAVTPAARHVETGMRYADQGQARQAEREWQTAVQLDPNNAQAWELLGEFYLSTSNQARAVTPFRQLLRLQPDTPQIHSRLAGCLLWAGDEIGAYKEAQQELKRNPDDISALAISALILSYLGEEQKQLTYLRRLVNLRPDDPEFVLMLAQALTFEHQYAEARPLLERVLEITPTNAQAFSLRGMGYFSEDSSPQGLKRAEEDFNQALRHDPLASFPRLYLGKIYRRRGEPRKAVALLEQLTRFLPRKTDILFELATAYEQAGQSEKAALTRQQFEMVRQEADQERILEKRCSVYPNNFDNHLKAGNLFLNKGDYRKASLYLNRARTLRPGDSRSLSALRQLASLTGGVNARAVARTKAAEAMRP